MFVVSFSCCFLIVCLLSFLLQGRQAKESKLQLINSTSIPATTLKIPAPAPIKPISAPIKRPTFGRKPNRKTPKPRKIPRFNESIPRYTAYEVRNSSLWSLEFGMFFTQENLSKLGIEYPTVKVFYFI